MKKRANPKADAMRDRSLIVESERQNLHTPKYYLSEQKVYKDIEDIKSDINLGDLIDSGIKVYKKSVKKWGEGNFIIKKDTVNKVWLSHKIGNETDKIELPLNEQIHAIDQDGNRIAPKPIKPTEKEPFSVNMDNNTTEIKIPLGKDFVKGVVNVTPTVLVLGVIAFGVGNLVDVLKSNQDDKIEELFKRIEFIVEQELSEEERYCLHKKKKPISIVNLKGLWDKEKQFNVWLSKCITDSNKLSKIIGDTKTILQTYKQDKDNKQQDRRDRREDIRN